MPKPADGVSTTSPVSRVQQALPRYGIDANKMPDAEGLATYKTLATLRLPQDTVDQLLSSAWVAQPASCYTGDVSENPMHQLKWHVKKIKYIDKPMVQEVNRFSAPASQAYRASHMSILLDNVENLRAYYQACNEEDAVSSADTSAALERLRQGLGLAANQAYIYLLNDYAVWKRVKVRYQEAMVGYVQRTLNNVDLGEPDKRMVTACFDTSYQRKLLEQEDAFLATLFSSAPSLLTRNEVDPVSAVMQDVLAYDASDALRQTETVDRRSKRYAKSVGDSARRQLAHAGRRVRGFLRQESSAHFGDIVETAAQDLMYGFTKAGQSFYEGLQGVEGGDSDVASRPSGDGDKDPLISHITPMLKALYKPSSTADGYATGLANRVEKLHRLKRVLEWVEKHDAQQRLIDAIKAQDVSHEFPTDADLETLFTRINRQITQVENSAQEKVKDAAFNVERVTYVAQQQDMMKRVAKSASDIRRIEVHCTDLGINTDIDLDAKKAVFAPVDNTVFVAVETSNAVDQTYMDRVCHLAQACTDGIAHVNSKKNHTIDKARMYGDDQILIDLVVAKIEAEYDGSEAKTIEAASLLDLLRRDLGVVALPNDKLAKFRDLYNQGRLLAQKEKIIFSEDQEICQDLMTEYSSVIAIVNAKRSQGLRFDSYTPMMLALQASWLGVIANTAADSSADTAKKIVASTVDELVDVRQYIFDQVIAWSEDETDPMMLPSAMYDMQAKISRVPDLSPSTREYMMQLSDNMLSSEVFAHVTDMHFFGFVDYAELNHLGDNQQEYYTRLVSCWQSLHEDYVEPPAAIECYPEILWRHVVGDNLVKLNATRAGLLELSPQSKALIGDAYKVRKDDINSDQKHIDAITIEMMTQMIKKLCGRISLNIENNDATKDTTRYMVQLQRGLSHVMTKIRAFNLENSAEREFIAAINNQIKTDVSELNAQMSDKIVAALPEYTGDDVGFSDVLDRGFDQIHELVAKLNTLNQACAEAGIAFTCVRDNDDVQSRLNQLIKDFLFDYASRVTIDTATAKLNSLVRMLRPIATDAVVKHLQSIQALNYSIFTCSYEERQQFSAAMNTSSDAALDDANALSGLYQAIVYFCADDTSVENKKDVFSTLMNNCDFSHGDGSLDSLERLVLFANISNEDFFTRLNDCVEVNIDGCASDYGTAITLNKFFRTGEGRDPRDMSWTEVVSRLHRSLSEERLSDAATQLQYKLIDKLQQYSANTTIAKSLFDALSGYSDVVDEKKDQVINLVVMYLDNVDLNQDLLGSDGYLDMVSQIASETTFQEQFFDRANALLDSDAINYQQLATLMRVRGQIDIVADAISCRADAFDSKLASVIDRLVVNTKNDARNFVGIVDVLNDLYDPDERSSEIWSAISKRFDVTDYIRNAAVFDEFALIIRMPKIMQAYARNDQVSVAQCMHYAKTSLRSDDELRLKSVLAVLSGIVVAKQSNAEAKITPSNWSYLDRRFSDSDEKDLYTQDFLLPLLASGYVELMHSAIVRIETLNPDCDAALIDQILTQFFIGFDKVDVSHKPAVANAMLDLVTRSDQSEQMRKALVEHCHRHIDAYESSEAFSSSFDVYVMKSLANVDERKFVLQKWVMTFSDFSELSEYRSQLYRMCERCELTEKQAYDAIHETFSEDSKKWHYLLPLMPVASEADKVACCLELLKGDAYQESTDGSEVHLVKLLESMRFNSVTSVLNALYQQTSLSDQDRYIEHCIVENFTRSDVIVATVTQRMKDSNWSLDGNVDAFDEVVDVKDKDHTAVRLEIAKAAICYGESSGLGADFYQHRSVEARFDIDETALRSDHIFVSDLADVLKTIVPIKHKTAAIKDFAAKLSVVLLDQYNPYLDNGVQCDIAIDACDDFVQVDELVGKISSSVTFQESNSFEHLNFAVKALQKRPHGAERSMPNTIEYARKALISCVGADDTWVDVVRKTRDSGFSAYVDYCALTIIPEMIPEHDRPKVLSVLKELRDYTTIIKIKTYVDQLCVQTYGSEAFPDKYREFLELQIPQTSQGLAKAFTQAKKIYEEVVKDSELSVMSIDYVPALHDHAYGHRRLAHPETVSNVQQIFHVLSTVRQAYQEKLSESSVKKSGADIQKIMRGIDQLEKQLKGLDSISRDDFIQLVADAVGLVKGLNTAAKKSSTFFMERRITTVMKSLFGVDWSDGDTSVFASIINTDINTKIQSLNDDEINCCRVAYRPFDDLFVIDDNWLEHQVAAVMTLPCQQGQLCALVDANGDQIASRILPEIVAAVQAAPASEALAYIDYIVAELRSREDYQSTIVATLWNELDDSFVGLKALLQLSCSDARSFDPKHIDHLVSSILQNPTQLVDQPKSVDAIAYERILENDAFPGELTDKVAAIPDIATALWHYAINNDASIENLWQLCTEKQQYYFNEGQFPEDVLNAGGQYDAVVQCRHLLYGASGDVAAIERFLTSREQGIDDQKKNMVTMLLKYVMTSAMSSRSPSNNAALLRIVTLIKNHGFEAEFDKLLGTDLARLCAGPEGSRLDKVINALTLLYDETKKPYEKAVATQYLKRLSSVKDQYTYIRDIASKAFKELAAADNHSALETDFDLFVQAARIYKHSQGLLRDRSMGSVERSRSLLSLQRSTSILGLRLGASNKVESAGAIREKYVENDFDLSTMPHMVTQAEHDHITSDVPWDRWMTHPEILSSHTDRLLEIAEAQKWCLTDFFINARFQEKFDELMGHIVAETCNDAYLVELNSELDAMMTALAEEQRQQYAVGAQTLAQEFYYQDDFAMDAQLSARDAEVILEKYHEVVDINVDGEQESRQYIGWFNPSNNDELQQSLLSKLQAYADEHADKNQPLRFYALIHNGETGGSAHVTRVEVTIPGSAFTAGGADPEITLTHYDSNGDASQHLDTIENQVRAAFEASEAMRFSRIMTKKNTSERQSGNACVMRSISGVVAAVDPTHAIAQYRQNRLAQLSQRSTEYDAGLRLCLLQQEAQIQFPERNFSEDCVVDPESHRVTRGCDALIRSSEDQPRVHFARDDINMQHNQMAVYRLQGDEASFRFGLEESDADEAILAAAYLKNSGHSLEVVLGTERFSDTAFERLIMRATANNDQALLGVLNAIKSEMHADEGQLAEATTVRKASVITYNKTIAEMTAAMQTLDQVNSDGYDKNSVISAIAYLSQHASNEQTPLVASKLKLVFVTLQQQLQDQLFLHPDKAGTLVADFKSMVAAYKTYGYESIVTTSVSTLAETGEFGDDIDTATMQTLFYRANARCVGNDDRDVAWCIQQYERLAQSNQLQSLDNVATPDLYIKMLQTLLKSFNGEETTVSQGVINSRVAVTLQLINQVNMLNDGSMDRCMNLLNKLPSRFGRNYVDKKGLATCPRAKFLRGVCLGVEKKLGIPLKNSRRLAGVAMQKPVKKIFAMINKEDALGCSDLSELHTYINNNIVMINGGIVEGREIALERFKLLLPCLHVSGKEMRDLIEDRIVTRIEDASMRNAVAADMNVHINENNQAFAHISDLTLRRLDTRVLYQGLAESGFVDMSDSSEDAIVQAADERRQLAHVELQIEHIVEDVLAAGSSEAKKDVAEPDPEFNDDRLPDTAELPEPMSQPSEEPHGSADAALLAQLPKMSPEQRKDSERKRLDRAQDGPILPSGTSMR